ncbi:MFS transporter [Streptomyces hebeiensis]|uniref:MFS transporter n=1 Tax=Streptomyces hebeiensis TaxID=229486 RepID=A0ABN1UN50_9ACTN
MDDKSRIRAGGDGAGRRADALTLTAMVVAASMTFIDQTIVAIAAPTIVHELGLTASGMQWVVNAYLLTLASFFALGGRLAHVFGHRLMVIAGTLVFVVSSILCAVVPAGGDVAQGWLIAFRATQGVGAALLFPAALAVVTETFPAERRGRALALFFGWSAVLTVLGPLLGGWLTAWTWRAIFWINVPVAAVALVLMAKARVPHVARRGPVDVPGAVLVAVGTALTVLGFQQAANWGWSSALTWLCVGLGLLVLALFCRYELYGLSDLGKLRALRGLSERGPGDHPLVPLRLFKDRAFAVDAAVLFFAMPAFVPVFFFGSVYAQVSLASSPQQAGLYLLYFFVGFVITYQWGSRFLDVRGAKPAILLGTALGTLGFALWASKLTDHSMHDQWPYVALAGAGIGFLLVPASTDAANRAAGASYEEVTALTQTVRTFSAALGLAVFGTILTHVTTDRMAGTLGSAGVPSPLAHSVGHDIAERFTGNGGHLVPTGTGPVDRITRDAIGVFRLDFAEANRAVFYGMAISLTVAFVCALFHSGHSRRPDRPDRPGHPDRPGRLRKKPTANDTGTDTAPGGNTTP